MLTAGQAGAAGTLSRPSALTRGAVALSSRRWAAGVGSIRRQPESAVEGAGRRRERLVVHAARGPRPYVNRTCSECKRRWRLKLSEKAWFEFHALPVPDRCGQCRTFRKLINERGASTSCGLLCTTANDTDTGSGVEWSGVGRRLRPRWRWWEAPIAAGLQPAMHGQLFVQWGSPHALRYA